MHADTDARCQLIRQAKLTPGQRRRRPHAQGGAGVEPKLARGCWPTVAARWRALVALDELGKLTSQARQARQAVEVSTATAAHMLLDIGAGMQTATIRQQPAPEREKG